MYCIKCGVKLSEGQTVCPICHTRVYHPDLPVKDQPTYPKKEFQSEEFNRHGLLFVITVLWLLPTFLPMIFELSWHGAVEWSGYVLGALLLSYITLILPFWFKNANPVIFVPCDFAAAMLYLLYIDLTLGEGWFLPFALPVAVVLGLIVTTIVTLCRYLPRGKLFVFGGALIALGAWTQMIAILIRVVFDVHFTVIWSLFSCATLLVLGLMLIVIGIVRPLRESLYKIFFIGR